MSHLSEMSCALLADDALPEAELTDVRTHVDNCPQCSERVRALASESAAIRAALVAMEPALTPPPFMPAPDLAAVLKWLAGLALAAVVVNGAWQAAWPTLALPQWLDWLLPDLSGLGLDVVFMLIGTLTGAGDVLPAALQGVMLLAALSVISAGGWLLLNRGGGGANTCHGVWAGAVILVLVTPLAQAFEVRAGEDRVVVGADEVIDDTLIIMGERVLVEGTVTGDLVAFGERVLVRGNIGGVVFAAGEEVSIEGGIRGTAMAAGKTVSFRDARLGGNVFAAGRAVTLYADAEVSGNAALAGAEVEIQGPVLRDVLAAGQQVALFGAVDGSLRVFGEELTLADDARVGGDLTATVRDAGDLSALGDARVGGRVEVRQPPREPPEYQQGHFYVGKAFGFLTAFVTGLVLFWLFPGLQAVRVNDGADALRTAGVGLLVLMATPILAVFALVTVIGIPLGLLAAAGWLAGLYLSGIVTAGLAGRLLVDAERGHVLAFLAGLALVFVLVNLPFVGGLLRLIVMAVGFGLLVQWQRRLWAVRTA